MGTLLFFFSMLYFMITISFMINESSYGTRYRYVLLTGLIWPYLVMRHIIRRW